MLKLGLKGKNHILIKLPDGAEIKVFLVKKKKTKSSCTVIGIDAPLDCGIELIKDSAIVDNSDFSNQELLVEKNNRGSNL